MSPVKQQSNGPVELDDRVWAGRPAMVVVTAAAVAIPGAAAVMFSFALVRMVRQHGAVVEVPAWLPWAAWAGSLYSVVVALICLGVCLLGRDTDRRALVDRVGLNAGVRLWLMALASSVATGALCGVTGAMVGLL